MQKGELKHRILTSFTILTNFLCSSPLVELTECLHTTIIKDLCADCGADLQQIDVATSSKASVPMIHSVPELKVSESLAKELGRADTDRLLKDRKLVLLVDLDQTLIHTTNDNVPNNLKVRNKINFVILNVTFDIYLTGCLSLSTLRANIPLVSHSSPTRHPRLSE